MHASAFQQVRVITITFSVNCQLACTRAGRNPILNMSREWEYHLYQTRIQNFGKKKKKKRRMYVRCIVITCSL